MITCDDPNDGADLGRWRDLIESVRGRVLGANIRLHKEFDRGLELLLCHQVPSAELSGVIREILAHVTLSIESEDITSPELLPALVRRVARQLIPMSVLQT